MMPRASVYGYGAFAALFVFSAWRLRPSRIPQEPPAAPLAARAAVAPAREIAPVDVSPDETPIHPAGSTEVDSVGMRPHPLTPTHARIFRENNLIGDLNGAMDVRDFAGLRALLQQYRDEYPEDANVLQDGYALIATCQERLTPAARAAAQRYYDEQLDSGLRRYIRRYCLEPPVL